MKVLHLLDELRPSGAEIMLRDSFPLWRAHGVVPGILATGASRGDFADQLQAAGYAVHHLPNDKRASFFMSLYRLLKSERVELVHQHTERTGFWLSATCLLAGCKVVRVLHNNFAFAGFLRWRRLVQRRLLHLLGVRFVSISEGVRRNEQELFGLPTRLIWNWADVERYRAPTGAERDAARARWAYGPADFVVVTVGNCSAVKNHAALIEALAACRDIPNLRYLHVGVGSDTDAEIALVDRLGLADRVRFAGRLDDALPALHAADAYAMPSLHEGFSIAAIEAFAVGLPALLTDVAGLRDVREFFPGVFFSDTAPEAIAMRLRELATQPAEALARRSRDYGAIARKEFSMARGVAEYASVYGRGRP